MLFPSCRCSQHFVWRVVVEICRANISLAAISTRFNMGMATLSQIARNAIHLVR